MKNRKLNSGFVKRAQGRLLLYFLAAIVIGAAVLKLPVMYKAGCLKWIDALFVAASAVCVTGLSTVKMAGFTFWGKLWILVLIQIGGFGIMTLSSSILLALGRKMSFSDALMISNLNDSFSLRGTESLTWGVFMYTFIAEGLGVLLMLPGMLFAVDGFSSSAGFGEALGSAVFLSISSFCNAGFSPFPDSLAGEGWWRWVQTVSLLLMITGGVGCYVIYDLKQRFCHRSCTLHAHTKLVLWTTAILLVGGALCIGALDWAGGGSLYWFDALYFSATARTCGFSTVPVENLPSTVQAVLIFLMLIGGSPGGTAGGIKTTTVALVFAAIYSVLRGNSEVLLFDRKVPTINVLRAFAIILIFSLMGCVGAIFLQTRQPDTDLFDTAFEAISALTTTGLSIGDTTAGLSWGGKLFLVFFMFFGRVGPFAVLLFLLDREKHTSIEYPEERIIIG